MLKKFIAILVITFIAFSLVQAESDFFKEFKKKYDGLDVDLLNYETEKFEVNNFVYQKDLATFTFKEGTIYLARYTDDRPTTAIFYGNGHAKIDIPSPAERNALKSISRKENIDEDFEISIMRFADDFDLKLKEHATGEFTKLKWKFYSPLKDEQADHYFKPVIQHRYDNNFQQLRSLYERNADGFFWIDFNRYNFTYDPNRPEEVIIGYEFEIRDLVITETVNLQKQSENKYTNDALSDVDYQVTALDKNGKIEMGGMDGTKVENAEATVKLLVNADSLKFISTFLHFHLKLDSLTNGGAPVDYYRRKDFNFIGIILPEYKYKGDTIELTYYYHGKDFDFIMPYVEDPTPSPHSFTFTVPDGYNYLMPGMGEVQKADKGKVSFAANPETPYSKFRFQGYASGYDTVQTTTGMGFPINFIKGKNIKKSDPCYVTDEIYESSITNAFNYMTQRVGPPPAVSTIYVFPISFKSMPGLVEVPQVELCYEEYAALGGFDIFSGYSMAKQWFGCLLKPATAREVWLKDVASLYLSFMSIQHNVSSGTYYSTMLNRRDSILTFRETNRDRPLSLGNRLPDGILTNRGVWLFHMLRHMMFDLEKNSESNFNRFMYELSFTVNNNRFKNTDVIALAEKYYGDKLDWFFDQFFYNCELPKFKVDYSIEKRDDGYYINGDVRTENVAPDFKMPVIMRVKGKDNSAVFLREMVRTPSHSFEFGPFEVEPDELVFNELFSVLSEDNVSKN